MKYIIMCGGPSCKAKLPKHLYQYKGEPLIKRTIRFLKEAGIKDLAITTSPNSVDLFKDFGVEVIAYEAVNDPYYWVDAFYPTEEPICYVYGDVFYSPEAIKTIVETETDDIEFFASAPPFASNYPKPWAEPFAFKVVNQKRFRECIEATKEWRGWTRHPLSWELWQVVKHTPRNRIDYTNYTTINDYSCDVDYESELAQWEKFDI